ncbi:Protease HtpX [Symmachiella macrocystis]|uniref:Protease HtpX n=1 Tax=Symmachiella macrocystis TaxID=2527985 RepID=A0A5C6BN06_9PLAN|nr:M56 family metallopeptidase [Symmachiella macrocystis]TWU12686.1 Protease HtpX [Symmachiella macrocystis]
MLQTLFEIVLANAVLATVLAIGVALFARLCRRPAIEHGLWLLVFLKLITPPLVTVPLEILPAPQVISTSSAVIPAPMETTISEHVAPAPLAIAATSEAPRLAVAPQPEGFRWRDHLAEGIVALWIAGACAWLLLLSIRAWRFHRIARLTALAPASLQQQVRRLAMVFSVSTVPDVRVIHAQVSPLLWRIDGCPVILLPAELLNQLTPTQIDGIFAHELAHLQRRDHWTRRLVLCVTALYWWHPVVWSGRRGLEQAAEQCCDAAVVDRFPNHSRDYAAALLQTIDFLSGARPQLPASATTFGPGRSLKRRFAMILDKGVSPQLSWKMRGVLAAVGLTVLAVSPWVVAEEKVADPQKPRVVDRESQPYTETQLLTKNGKVDDINEKRLYKVACRMLAQDENGKEHAVFSPQIVLRENEEGTITVGAEQPVPVRDADPVMGRQILKDRALRQVKVRQLDDEFVAFIARIDDSPEMNKGLFPDDDGVVTREFTHIYTKSLNVVEKVQLGRTFSVPFYDKDDNKKAKRRIEFVITRLEPPKPKLPDEATLLFPTAVNNPPTVEEVLTEVSKQLKDRGDVPPFAASAVVKNLRVVIEPSGPSVGPVKFYPLVGHAQMHKQRYKCTAYFDLQRQSDWPIRFMSRNKTSEVVYIDHDHLVRVTKQPK